MCALIKLGALVTGISGKVGGQTFGIGKAGNYLKNTGSYINARTIKRVLSNINLQAVTSAWRTLTVNERTAWNSAAPSFPYINRLGQVKVYSGFNLFGKFNSNLRLINQFLIDVPPAPTIIILPTAMVLTFDTNTYTVQLLGTNGSNRYAVYASAPQSVGQVSNKLNYKLLSIQTAATLNLGHPFINDYKALYGNPIFGSRSFVKVKTVLTTSGIAGNINLFANEEVS